MSTTDHNEDRDSGHLRKVLVALAVIKADAPDDEIPMDSVAADRLLAKISTQDEAASVVRLLFPAGTPLDTRFYEALSDLRCWLGVDDSAIEAIGRLWSAAMSDLPPEDQQQLLMTLTAPGNHDFHECMQSLPHVVADHDIPAEFCLPFFARVAIILQGDVGYGFGESARAMIEHHPRTAISLVRQAVQTPGPAETIVATCFLGILRTRTLPEDIQSDFKQVETAIASHDDPDVRSIYNWSWCNTAYETGISSDQFQALIQRADSDNPGETDDVIAAASRTILSNHVEQEVFADGLAWLHDNVTRVTTSQGKQNVITTASRLVRGLCVTGEKQPDCTEWLVALQPVPASDLGSWAKIEDCLVETLAEDIDRFRSLFRRLAEVAAGTIHEVMQEPRQFRRLMRELKKADIAALIGELCVSHDMACRRLGLYLFDRLEVDEIPQSVFPADDTNAVQRVFFELQRTMRQPEALARLFVSMLPQMERADENFSEWFADELKVQIRNFGGGCRQELERLAGDHSIVKSALEAATEACEALQRAHDAGINGMEVTGHRRAAVLDHRRLARDMKHGIARHSFFFNPGTQFEPIFGRTVSIFIDGNLRDSTPLIPFSGNVELPFVDFRDPEEMAMRRICASKNIKAIQDVDQTDD